MDDTTLLLAAGNLLLAASFLVHTLAACWMGLVVRDWLRARHAAQPQRT